MNQKTQTKLHHKAIGDLRGSGVTTVQLCKTSCPVMGTERHVRTKDLSPRLSDHFALT